MDLIVSQHKSLLVKVKEHQQYHTTLCPVNLYVSESPLFQCPTIVLPLFDCFICCCGKATFESFLEPHLTGQGHGTPDDVSNAFIIMAIFSMASSVLSGFVSFTFDWAAVMVEYWIVWTEAIISNVFQ